MSIQNSQGATLVVGAKGLKNPTPMALRWLFRIILYLSGVWALFIAPNVDVPDNIQAEINKWLLVGNGIINHAIKYFGWDFVPENTNN